MSQPVIPAPLPPPTADEVDAAVASQVASYFQSYAAMNLQNNQDLFMLRSVVVAWTQHDGSLNYMIDSCDPTVNGGDTVTCRGLVAEYGAVVIRVYEWAVALPSLAEVTAPDEVQDAANDPAQWVAPQ